MSVVMRDVVLATGALAELLVYVQQSVQLATDLWIGPVSNFEPPVSVFCGWCSASRMAARGAGLVHGRPASRRG